LRFALLALEQLEERRRCREPARGQRPLNPPPDAGVRGRQLLGGPLRTAGFREGDRKRQDRQSTLSHIRSIKLPAPKQSLAKAWAGCQSGNGYAGPFSDVAQVLPGWSSGAEGGRRPSIGKVSPSSGLPRPPFNEQSKPTTVIEWSRRRVATAFAELSARAPWRFSC
jgi:hypothetical protein